MPGCIVAKLTSKSINKVGSSIQFRILNFYPQASVPWSFHCTCGIELRKFHIFL